MWWDSSTDKTGQGQRGWPPRAELIKLAGYKSWDQLSHTPSKVPWRTEMKEASTTLTQVYWASAMDQALNSLFAQLLIKSSYLLSEKILASLQKQTQGMKWLFECCTLQGGTRSRTKPAIALSPRPPPLFSAMVLYIFIFLFPAQWNVKSHATEYSGSLTQHVIEIASAPVPSPGLPRPCSRHCWKETVPRAGEGRSLALLAMLHSLWMWRQWLPCPILPC